MIQTTEVVGTLQRWLFNISEQTWPPGFSQSQTASGLLYFELSGPGAELSFPWRLFLYNFDYPLFVSLAFCLLYPVPPFPSPPSHRAQGPDHCGLSCFMSHLGLQHSLRHCAMHTHAVCPLCGSSLCGLTDPAAQRLPYLHFSVNPAPVASDQPLR